MHAQFTSTTHIALILTEPEARRVYALAVDAIFGVPPGQTRAMLKELVLVLEPMISAQLAESPR